MNFLNPLVLFGLAASAIPIIIHLLNLRRKRKQDFSTLRFIKELKDNKIRKLKIRQWLLLVLRTLLIASIVMAFARPVIDTAIPGFVNYSKTNAVIVLDNTYSMNISDQFGNRFRRAKLAGSDITSVLQKGDLSEIVPIVNYKEFDDYTLQKTMNEVNEALTSTPIQISKPKLDDAILKSQELFDENPNLNSEIFIISDGQKNLFDNIDTNKSKNVGSNVKFIKVFEASENTNLSIDSIKVLSTIFQYGRQIDYLVYITNHSKSDVYESILSLSLNDERISQRSFDLKAGENIELAISAPVNYRGAVQGEFSLEEDELSEDNKFYFGFLIPDKIKVASFANRKNHFANIALKSANIDLSSFEPKDLSSLNFNDYDVVYLINGDYSESDLRRVFAYVKTGGRAFIFNNNASQENFDKILVDNGFSNRSEPKIDGSARFSNVEKLHPIFEGVFKSDDPNKRVTGPEIQEMKILKDGISLINTDYGSFLSELIYGEGKLLYAAVEPNLNVSNLPLSNIFPAVMVRSSYYLTAESESGQLGEVSGKSVIKINPSESGNGVFTITDPNNNDYTLEGAKLASGTVVILENLNLAGHYLVKNSDEKTVAVLSINHDSDESKASYLSNDEISNKLRTILPNARNIDVIDNPKEIDESTVRASLGTELWKIFLILALLFAIAEMLVQKIYKSEV